MFNFSTLTCLNIYYSGVVATFGILSYIDSKNALLEYRESVKSNNIIINNSPKNENDAIMNVFYSKLIKRILLSLSFPVTILENVYINAILFFNKNTIDNV